MHSALVVVLVVVLIVVVLILVAVLVPVVVLVVVLIALHTCGNLLSQSGTPLLCPGIFILYILFKTAVKKEKNF